MFAFFVILQEGQWAGSLDISRYDTVNAGIYVRMQRSKLNIIGGRGSQRGGPPHECDAHDWDT